MTQIPDPTIDLDWSGYAGSIHSHFSRAAQTHPDRVCVVETQSEQHPERVFTYRQIYEASNILAHFLCEAGVTNGDVVMVWAHRSVDLVIAIMGTLASSATMSILDPAYPPARQQVYLEVAQPCALINLARATDEAGPLAPVVRRYIDSELTLKAELPALRLHDGGHLTGVVSGEDPFANVRNKAQSAPNTLVGPDSIPTLSFTSGSEGRPKGVQGRHFSLVKYFAWMAERFDLTSESRFTLLSGIAHDPVQRDIFTPLFLGAQLLVPSKDDISHERLAEWMSIHKPTVTHLTPAMGQILVGGASAEFPSLKTAFFVGDVLTTRDCKSLRNLAVNANIVNMYGTTETQRAVSYFEIPCRAKSPHFLETLKSTVPAGQGMQNVQLLVVNREDRAKLCSIGEIGEIYVRAAGLAEGYKGDQAMTDQKFLMNWFVQNENWVEAYKNAEGGEAWRKFYKGPRDRLYKTGDLGRYLESGDVECTGRADDQVKIRGFRIELNDIDSNLSQSCLIRDCKTLVRRDRNEEPILVSYIVPEIQEWPSWLAARGLSDIQDEGTDYGSAKVYLRRFRRMQTEVRDHLKGRLPIYAVPSTYIVLNKLPLNPNGKVDKPNLPFPDIIEQTQDASAEDVQAWSGLTDLERNVATIWAELIRGVNAKTIRRDDDFFDLGGHSLLAQQMLLKIRLETGANISINSLYENPTLAGFCTRVAVSLDKATQPNQQSESVDSQYEESFKQLVKSLPQSIPTADATKDSLPQQLFVFLTGATGFLGAYIIKDLLSRKSSNIHLIAHVRGVKDAKSGIIRLQRSLEGYGIWEDSWISRIDCVVGDLAKPQLGIDDQAWKSLAQKVDVIIHNGAIVHWVKRYQDMLASNVLSTLDLIHLCSIGKAKTLTFISSTSVLDTDHYVKLSEKQISTGQNAISEEDDLRGSSLGLGTGYGQTKWVSEQLVRSAGTRGLSGSIVRPGYILGDSASGVSNTDDFLIRLLKGCIQLGVRPRIFNTINAVPINHVARVSVAAALSPIAMSSVHVIHVTGHPRLRMNEYLSFLEYYGYQVGEVDYDLWKDELEKYVSAGGPEKDQEQHALMPLYHFCVNDLPATTRAPELDDRNAVAVLKSDADVWTGIDESSGHGITRDDVGRYLRYLSEIGFIDRPKGRGRPLPELSLGLEQIKAIGAIGGRGGNAK